MGWFYFVGGEGGGRLTVAVDQHVAASEELLGGDAQGGEEDGESEGLHGDG